MATSLKQTVRVVTDSTADMSAEELRSLNVEMVPLKVLAGSETYRDGLDITPHDFYVRLPKWSPLPTTSQPAPGEFMGVYKRCTEDGSKVISIHLSSKLSGTYQNATTAAAEFPTGQIRTFDTEMVSAGVALYVRKAVELARLGATLEEIEAALTSMRSRVKMVATVNTLEYLHKGGRIGGLRSFVGSVLGIKPIFHLKEGEVKPLEQVRTRGKALQRMAEMVKSWGPIERVAIMHAEDSDGAGELADLIAPALSKDIERYISYVGPVIGTHTGPGTIGVVVLLKQ